MTHSATPLPYISPFALTRKVKDIANKEDYNKKMAKRNFSQEMVMSLLGSGFSTRMIAKKINVSKSTIQKIGSGQVKSPRHIIFSNLLSLYVAIFIVKLN